MGSAWAALAIIACRRALKGIEGLYSVATVKKNALRESHLVEPVYAYANKSASSDVMTESIGVGRRREGERREAALGPGSLRHSE